jgi:hypothetical protein
MRLADKCCKEDQTAMRRSRHYRSKRRGIDAIETGPQKPSTAPTNIAQLRPRHLTRVTAQLIYDEGIGKPKTATPAAVVLNEVTPTGILLFSKAKFAREQQLTLNIPGIRNFYIKGKVVACKEMPLSAGLVFAQSFGYRIELKWIFRSEAERAAVQEYCRYLGTNYLDDAA